MKVASILKRKGADVATVRPDATIAEAARELRTKGIGALVVSEDGRTMLGVVTCAADASITTVMEDMTRHRVRHIPVTEGRELRGMVSIGDVVKHRLEELETETNILREVVIARR